MPVPVSASGGHGSHGPTLFDKMKLGAIMGTSVGLCIGFLFGGYNLMKHGAGPNGFLRSLGQYMLGSAATFGFFMSIGTAIRTETDSVAMKEFARMRAAPVVLEMQRRKRRGEI
ncbi:reactive mitochondrial oxygen species modulator 1-domain-containing protein [Tuber indicum]|nr:reactive mitochondrial oxygen species modulator 1-domain-containing protein [Tuber indicum]